MNDAYGVFKGHVTAIRGKRLKKDIESERADAFIHWHTGVKLGLVDKVGEGLATGVSVSRGS